VKQDILFRLLNSGPKSTGRVQLNLQGLNYQEFKNLLLCYFDRTRPSPKWIVLFKHSKLG